MPIDIYLVKFSPPSRAVQMTAKQLNLDFNLKICDISCGDQLKDEFKKVPSCYFSQFHARVTSLQINPGHTIPTINDNGFILWESRAIMQYLCDQYAPDTTLYPRAPKERAIIDRWLNFDSVLFSGIRDVLIRPAIFENYWTVNEIIIITFRDNLSIFDQMIGINKYINGKNLTLADLSSLANVTFIELFNWDLTEYANIERWYTDLKQELPYFDEINKFTDNEFNDYVSKMRAFYTEFTQFIGPHL